MSSISNMSWSFFTPTGSKECYFSLDLQLCYSENCTWWGERVYTTFILTQPDGASKNLTTDDIGIACSAYCGYSSGLYGYGGRCSIGFPLNDTMPMNNWFNSYVALYGYLRLWLYQNNVDDLRHL